MAAANGHLNVREYLEKKVSPEEETLQYMIATNDFNAFRRAKEYSHLNVTQHLLSYAAVFAYAEAQHLDAVFDVAQAKEAKLLFYVARNLIRRNDRGLIDDLRFLLSLPAVKALAHTALRYLSKPNPWMHEHASYVCINECAYRVLVYL